MQIKSSAQLLLLPVIVLRGYPCAWTSKVRSLLIIHTPTQKYNVQSALDEVTVWPVHLKHTSPHFTSQI
jgi:hypothetical protein